MTCKPTACILLAIGAHYVCGGLLQAQQTTTDGVVEGLVVGVDGQPVAHATIETEAVNRRDLRPQFTETDTNGTFTLKNVPAAKYLIHAYKEDEWYPNTSYAIFAADLAAIPQIEVLGDSNTAHVTIRLRRGGRLAGRITDSAGRPVVGARIHIGREDDPRLIFSAGPEEDGRFTFVVPIKPLILWITCVGYKTWYFKKGDSKSDTGPSDVINIQPETTKEMSIVLMR